MADNIDLYASGLGNAGTYFEVVVYFADRFFQVPLQVAIFDTGNLY